MAKIIEVASAGAADIEAYVIGWGVERAADSFDLARMGALREAQEMADRSGKVVTLIHDAPVEQRRGLGVLAVVLPA